MRRTTLLVMAMVVAVTLVSGVFLGDETASAQSTDAVTGTIIEVNTKVDESNPDGDCSLREAIEAANTNVKVDRCKAGSATKQDTIRFALGKKAKTIVLVGSQLPAITDPSGLRINDQKGKITISGDEQFRVFEVAQGAQLALRNLTVADGSADGSAGGSAGAGLLNLGGTVTVGNTTFTNNSGGSGLGGGIYSDGAPLTVTNSTFTNNSAGDGGGIYSDGAPLEVTNSTFTNNNAGFKGGGESGGGIFHSLGTLEVTNSTFTNNGAGSEGGGILIFGAQATVTNSTFSENSAARGGGLYNYNQGGTLEVTNSTFSENSAFEVGGGGITNVDGTAKLRNTIVANSTGGNCAVLDNGTITDGGYNIEDGTSCGFSEQQDSLPNTNPFLADQLANNGGPTQTIALQPTSPATNAIPPSVNGCGTEIKTDQRGVSRPQGSGCDIGAYEKKVRSR
jgi:CSLREA domain-containing protein